MAELRALRFALTRTGNTLYIEVEAFVGQVFVTVRDIENINTLSQILLTFNSILSGGLIHPGNIPLSITESVRALQEEPIPHGR